MGHFHVPLAKSFLSWHESAETQCWMRAYSRYMVRQGRIQDFLKRVSFICRAAAIPRAVHRGV